MKTIGAGIYSVSWPLSHAVAIFTHLYAVYIAYDQSGNLAAVITLMMPFVAEIYWFFDMVAKFGWEAPFALAVYAFIGLSFCNGLSIGMMSKGLEAH